MNITIFSGGSGSENIQKGLWNLFKDNIKINIIINCYDDGKSSGIVRKIFNNEILGPSDLRKNQLLRHKLRYGETDLYKFLNHRFTSNLPEFYIIDLINKYNFNIDIKNNIINVITNFFKYENSLNYNYNDFNIGNLIYSYYLYYNGVEETINIMNKMLNIPKEVYIQSHECLFLSAITDKNTYIDNEEDIVNFNNYNEKIKNIFLKNKNNEIIIPTLNDEVINIINKSDIIIFSCGTLWSSLIPTYTSNNFYKIIKESKSTKYLIMNIINDNDMINCVNFDYLEIYNKYLPLNDITLI